MIINNVFFKNLEASQSSWSRHLAKSDLNPLRRCLTLIYASRNILKSIKKINYEKHLFWLPTTAYQNTLKLSGLK